MGSESRGCEECNAENFCEVWNTLKARLDKRDEDMRVVLEDMFEHHLGVRPKVNIVEPDSEEGVAMKSRIVENREKGEKMRKDWDEMTDGNPYGH